MYQSLQLLPFCQVFNKVQSKLLLKKGKLQLANMKYTYRKNLRQNSAEIFAPRHDADFGYKEFEYLSLGPR